jgi:predicted DNA repair protein MutK
MAGASLLTLLDDIVSVLDDVATMTKVATSKTAGVLGDDLALNAQQVSGVRADRELPVIWKVAKGSFKNKLILVPSALLISLLLPWLIKPLLMLGGAYLCFEGVEKLYHKLFHAKEDQQEKKEIIDAFYNPTVDLVEVEKDKIKGAIRTDFILSAEIIVISLGTVADKSFLVQIGVLSLVALLMTVGVYGLVAAIIRIDDMGLALTLRSKSPALALKRIVGRGLLLLAPALLKLLSVLGTLAMFLVGGGILVHGIPYLHHIAEASSVWLAQTINLSVGVLAGIVVLAVLKIFYRK